MNDKIICRLYNKQNQTTEIYKGYVYTNIDGIFGYICVEGFKVLFFWCDGSTVCCDELDRFKVSYETA